MPAAARVGDKHVCSHASPVPHVGGSVVEPAASGVYIGKRLAARVGDLAFCDGGAYDVIVTGEPTVLVEGSPAARLGDATDGGHLVAGDATVLIGPDPRAALLGDAAELRSPTSTCGVASSSCPPRKWNESGSRSCPPRAHALRVPRRLGVSGRVCGARLRLGRPRARRSRVSLRTSNPTQIERGRSFLGTDRVAFNTSRPMSRGSTHAEVRRLVCSAQHGTLARTFSFAPALPSTRSSDISDDSSSS